MKLYSYVVARDFGFAPNPFFGICTLATCKPRTRSVAQVGDWIVGTSSRANYREARIVFAMCVAEAMDFNSYWSDPRFQKKKPNLRGSKKQAFGDNIYFRNSKTGQWHQENSHHSFSDGSSNSANIVNDTQVDRVLIAQDFVYWGGAGPKIPKRFMDYGPTHLNICAIRNHKSNFPPSLVEEFVGWVQSLGQHGYSGEPLDWSHTA